MTRSRLCVRDEAEEEYERIDDNSYVSSTLSSSSEMIAGEDTLLS